MANAESAFPSLPAPEACAPEPTPLVASTPEPAVVALAPRVEQVVNFLFCYRCSLAFSSTVLSFRLPICSLSMCFYV